VKKVGDTVPVVGGPVSDLGQQGEDSVHDVANLLGLITFVYCSSRSYGSEKAAR
jgi:hypothetical protein